jgi:iron complex outermembrane receptor protein
MTFFTDIHSECKYISRFLILLSFSFISTSIIAQPNNDDSLEEVLVFAQRKEQNNQQVAIATSVLTDVNIKRNMMANIVDAGTAIPALVVSSFNTANPQFFIRGIGSTGTSAGEDSSVSVVIDDIFLGRSGIGSLDFLDLERVEVLRGAQGTLFGRNSAGGVVQFITKKPTNERNGYLETHIGRFNRFGFKAASNSTLRENHNNSTLIRTAISYIERDGYVTNTTTGTENLRESEDFAGRIHLLQDWSSASTLLTLDYARSDQLGAASRKAATNNDPLIAGGLVLLPQPSTDINEITSPLDSPTQRESVGLSLKFETETSLGNFSSISAWRNNEYELIEDISAVGVIIDEQNEDAKNLVQEFRLSSKTQTKHQWTIGLYHFEESIDRIDVIDLTTISDTVNLSPFITIPDELVTYDQNAKNKSNALYGQIEFNLSDTLSSVIGGRYSKDKKQLTVISTGADPLNFGLLDNGPFTDSVSQEFSQFTGKLGFNYQPNDNLLAYILYSEGYKSGGFDGTASSSESLNIAFDAETSDALEIGLKTQWLNNTLRTNLALFYTDFDNLQVLQIDNNGTPFISNAASAKVQGIEVEISSHFTKNLESNLSCTFLDNTYRDFISAVDDNFDGAPDDLRGQRLTRSPKYSCHASIDFKPTINGKTPLNIHFSYANQDSMFISPQNRPFDTIDSYYILNLSLNYQLSESFSIMLYGRNITDEEYKLHTFDADPLNRNNIESSVYADPVTWGATARYNF